MVNNTDKFPFFQQFSSEQLKQQYKKNAEQLKQMRDKAIITGKKVNGFTASYLHERYEFFLSQSK